MKNIVREQDPLKLNATLQQEADRKRQTDACREHVLTCTEHVPTCSQLCLHVMVQKMILPGTISSLFNLSLSIPYVQNF